MKQNLFYILIIVLLYSCNSDKYKSELLGNWYFYDKPESAKHLNEFRIYSDSIVINSIMGRSTAMWKATNSQIILYDIKGYSEDSNITYDYRLKSNNLLDLKIYKDTMIEFKDIVKARNAMDFLQKSTNLKIDLPKVNKELIEIGNNRYNFTIYAGYRADKLVFKTDYSSTLERLEEDISKFKSDLKEIPLEAAKFVIVADKNIPKPQMDSLLQKLGQSSIKRNFRVLTNENYEYENNLYWMGDSE
tara:strand:+ start:7934 stop:8671 length:738 start_codon:yes stop_codon:yes gene_type:complete